MNHSASHSTRSKVLLAESEVDLRNLMQDKLERAGFQVVPASTGLQALKRAATEQPDVVVLDLQMAVMGGLEVCRQLRRDQGSRLLSIVMLTPQGQEQGRVQALNAGADVYLEKPLSLRILTSQIRALLRSVRRSTELPEVVRVGDLEIDCIQYTVYRVTEGRKVPLYFSRQEFVLLHFMAAQPEMVFSREMLLSCLWNTEGEIMERTVDVHVWKIRAKLGSAYIETVKGVGYRFRKPG